MKMINSVPGVWDAPQPVINGQSQFSYRLRCTWYALLHLDGWPKRCKHVKEKLHQVGGSEIPVQGVFHDLKKLCANGYLRRELRRFGTNDYYVYYPTGLFLECQASWRVAL